MKSHILFLLLLLLMPGLSSAGKYMECMELGSEGKNLLSVTDPVGEKMGMITEEYGKREDPGQALLGCFTAASFDKPQNVIKNCACKKAVKDLCKKKKGKWFGVSGEYTPACKLLGPLQ